MIYSFKNWLLIKTLPERGANYFNDKTIAIIISRLQYTNPTAQKYLVSLFFKNHKEQNENRLHLFIKSKILSSVSQLSLRVIYDLEQYLLRISLYCS